MLKNNLQHSLCCSKADYLLSLGTQETKIVVVNFRGKISTMISRVFQSVKAS